MLNRLIRFTPLFVLLLLITACASKEKSPKPKKDPIQTKEITLDGELSFQSEDTLQGEFLHLIIDQTAIEGTFYGYNDFYGCYSYTFHGTISSDSDMDVFINDGQQESSSITTWKYAINGNQITLKHDLENIWSQTFILADQIPLFEDCGTVAGMEMEFLGEYLENVLPMYYESQAPDPMKHNGGLHEYFRMVEVQDSVIGFGVGIADGTPMWYFDYSGTIFQDSIYSVTVNYLEGGQISMTTQEEWIRTDNGVFILKGFDRPETGRRFTYVSEYDLLESIQEGFTIAGQRTRYDTISPWELYDKNKP